MPARLTATSSSQCANSLIASGGNFDDTQATVVAGSNGTCEISIADTGPAAQPTGFIYPALPAFVDAVTPLEPTDFSSQTELQTTVTNPANLCTAYPEASAPASGLSVLLPPTSTAGWLTHPISTAIDTVTGKFFSANTGTSAMSLIDPGIPVPASRSAVYSSRAFSGGGQWTGPGPLYYNPLWANDTCLIGTLPEGSLAYADATDLNFLLIALDAISPVIDLNTESADSPQCVDPALKASLQLIATDTSGPTDPTEEFINVMDTDVPVLLSKLLGCVSSNAASNTIDLWLAGGLEQTTTAVKSTLFAALAPATEAGAFLKLDNLEEYSHAVESSFITLGSPFGSAVPPAPSITTNFFLSLPPYLTTVWGDSGVNLLPGQSVSITASGRVRYSIAPPQDCYSSPAGYPWGATIGGHCGGPCPDYSSVFYPQTPAPGLPCWSLIGRIGTDGKPFEVGNQTTFVVPQGGGGELYLGYNDWYYPDVVGDYSGGFSTRITVSGTRSTSTNASTPLPADQVLSSGSYEGSSTVGSCGLDYGINSGDQETLAATGALNLFVGATSGGQTMTPISWNEDLGVIASYSGLEAISIGQSSSPSGSFQTGANDAIAGVAVRACTATKLASNQTSSGTTLSIDVPGSSGPAVILLGGEGTGYLSASGGQALQTLVNTTFSEHGSNVIASTAIFVLPASTSPTTITFSSTTFGTNSGTALGAVAYVVEPVS